MAKTTRIRRYAGGGSIDSLLESNADEIAGLRTRIRVLESTAKEHNKRRESLQQQLDDALKKLNVKDRPRSRVAKDSDGAVVCKILHTFTLREVLQTPNGRGTANLPKADAERMLSLFTRGATYPEKVDMKVIGAHTICREEVGGYAESDDEDMSAWRTRIDLVLRIKIDD